MGVPGIPGTPGTPGDCIKSVRVIPFEVGVGTLLLNDQVIAMYSHELILPDATSFSPNDNEERCYTIIKASDNSTSFEIFLSGTDEWYMNRGYNNKVIESSGEQVTIKHLKVGGVGYWSCIDDIITTLALRLVSLTLTSTFVPLPFTNVFRNDNPLIMTYLLPGTTLSIKIDGVYDISYSVEIESFEGVSTGSIATAGLFIGGDANPIPGSVSNVRTDLKTITYIHAFARRVRLVGGSTIQLRVMEDQVPSGTASEVVNAQLTATQKDIQS